MYSLSLTQGNCSSKSPSSGNRTSDPVQALDHMSNLLPLGYFAWHCNIWYLFSRQRKAWSQWADVILWIFMMMELWNISKSIAFFFIIFKNKNGGFRGNLEIMHFSPTFSGPTFFFFFFFYSAIKSNSLTIPWLLRLTFTLKVCLKTFR